MGSPPREFPDRCNYSCTCSLPFRRTRLLLHSLLVIASPRRPAPQQASHRHELTDVVGGMIGREQELPQVRLAGSVRYRLFELNSRVSRHCLERVAIDLEFSETRRPRGG